MLPRLTLLIAGMVSLTLLPAASEQNPKAEPRYHGYGAAATGGEGRPIVEVKTY